MPRIFSITFFTVVMNRLHHLALTLPANLRDNTMLQTSFLILDYGSTDGAERYIRKHFGEEVENKRLKYVRVEAEYFHRSRSRNLAAALCDGEILCNIDADNYIGQGFDEYLSREFETDPEIFISALGSRAGTIDSIGKIAVTRHAFNKINGYDETFSGYGYEDYDLAVRLQHQGIRKVTIEDPAYLHAIKHSRKERIANEWHMRNLKALYTQQVNETTRVLLFLYRDQTLEYGIVVENRTGYRFSLVGKQWQQGHWDEQSGKVHLAFSELECTLDRSGNILCQGNHFLRLESDPDKIEEAVLFNTEIANRYRLHQTPIYPTP